MSTVELAKDTYNGGETSCIILLTHLAGVIGTRLRQASLGPSPAVVVKRHNGDVAVGRR